jgi:hypothetical protein
MGKQVCVADWFGAKPTDAVQCRREDDSGQQAGEGEEMRFARKTQPIGSVADVSVQGVIFIVLGLEGHIFSFTC